MRCLDEASCLRHRRLKNYSNECRATYQAAGGQYREEHYDVEPGADAPGDAWGVSEYPGAGWGADRQCGANDWVYSSGVREAGGAAAVVPDHDVDGPVELLFVSDQQYGLASDLRETAGGEDAEAGGLSAYYYYGAGADLGSPDL